MRTRRRSFVRSGLLAGAILIGVNLLSCKTDRSAITAIPDFVGGDTIISIDSLPGGVYPEALIPAGIGNYWVYVDSIWEGDRVRVQLDSVAIDSAKIEYGMVWWYLSDWIYPLWVLGWRFAVKNDTVYSVKYLTQWHPVPMIEFVPVRDSVVHYWVSYGGDVGYVRYARVLPHSFSTPAGVFDSCLVYVDPPGGLTHIIAPGVGVIYKSDSTHRRTAHLLRYHISQTPVQIP